VGGKVEEESEDPTIKGALVTTLLLLRPLLVEDLEGNILVGCPSVEAEDAEFRAVGGLDEELGSLGLVDEVGVENAELVTLNNLGGRIVVVVVRLVVLVPVPSRLDPVEVARLPGLVLVRPSIGGRFERDLVISIHGILGVALLHVGSRSLVGARRLFWGDNALVLELLLPGLDLRKGARSKATSRRLLVIMVGGMREERAAGKAKR